MGNVQRNSYRWYAYSVFMAPQRWEMHVQSAEAPTRPSAALVALRAWAGITRKAGHADGFFCAVKPCRHAYMAQDIPPICYQNARAAFHACSRQIACGTAD